jgi:hypothetical protein
VRTNLIFKHSVADILDQAAKFIRILGVVQKSGSLALLCQGLKVFKNTVQFPIVLCTLDRVSTMESVRLPFKHLPPFFLLDLTLGHGCD